MTDEFEVTIKLIKNKSCPQFYSYRLIAKRSDGLEIQTDFDYDLLQASSTLKRAVEEYNRGIKHENII